ncbi:transposase IS605 OrfB family [Candidatus Omnitrophus magneticus]|uniref:Transposase IS605 OrfB family n=1 Tax=Candidatus Omnitrophus magneticus TaxID=1609969 RepID=A0A0F0CQX5_9BACT|nr:transposase IS605 OrfB family [Candidatus Omnitrophus magneticus]
MRKAFKYRAKANCQTQDKAEHCLDLCRGLYNNMLEQRIHLYNTICETISAYEQMKELPGLKREHPEYKQVGSQVLRDVLERLEKAYKAFFRRVKNGETPGFPRFKSKDRYDSFTLKQAGWKWGLVPWDKSPSMGNI